MFFPFLSKSIFFNFCNSAMTYKLFSKTYTSLFLLLLVLFCSCEAYKYSTTFKDAQDTYLLITGNKESFGDKRLSYNKHTFCALKSDFFCTNNHRKNPDFIYEYNIAKNKNGLELFYIDSDSVFVFEEVSKLGGLIKKEKRKISEFEYKVYQKLLEIAKSKQ